MGGRCNSPRNAFLFSAADSMFKYYWQCLRCSPLLFIFPWLRGWNLAGNRMIYVGVRILFPCFWALGMCTQRTLYREYLMIHRGLGLLAVEWFGTSSIPFPPSFVCKLSLFLSIPGRGSNLLTEDGEGRGRGGAKSHDREKAWPYINHSILFDPMHPRTPLSSPHPVTAPPKVCGGAGHPAFWKGGGEGKGGRGRG